MDKSKSEIAKENGAYPATVTRLISGDRKTANIPLAVEVAKLTGRAPIEFISNNIKELALKVNPKLNNIIRPDIFKKRK